MAEASPRFRFALDEGGTTPRRPLGVFVRLSGILNRFTQESTYL